jgi:hypothetical protein
MLGDLLDVIVPGLILQGGLGVLVIATPVGPMIFGGPWVFTLLTVVAGVLVTGYLVAGLQAWIGTRRATWQMPPGSHFADEQPTVELPARAVERAGFTTTHETIEVPHGDAYALERSLAGAWGIPEDTWNRAIFLQRITVAFTLAAIAGVVFVLGDVAMGQGLSRGIRTHAGLVIPASLVTGWLTASAAQGARRAAILDLLADARAMVVDRGEHREVRRVLDELGLGLAEEETDESNDETWGVPR